jgi:hypothetical protein
VSRLGNVLLTLLAATLVLGTVAFGVLRLYTRS